MKIKTLIEMIRSINKLGGVIEPIRLKPIRKNDETSFRFYQGEGE